MSVSDTTAGSAGVDQHQLSVSKSIDVDPDGICIQVLAGLAELAHQDRLNLTLRSYEYSTPEIS
jgi:hypothetical protein